MSTEIRKQISGKYERRFGQTAVKMGFLSEDRLQAALQIQSEADRTGQPHRLIGTILFDQEWMTSDQIEKLLTALLKDIRLEESAGLNGSIPT